MVLSPGVFVLVLLPLLYHAAMVGEPDDRHCNPLSWTENWSRQSLGGGESLLARQGREPVETSQTTVLGFPVYTVNTGINKRNNL